MSNRRTPQPKAKIQRKKNGFKVALEPLFLTTNNCAWVGSGFIWETDYKNPNPTKVAANTLLIQDNNESLHAKEANKRWNVRANWGIHGTVLLLVAPVDQTKWCNLVTATKVDGASSNSAK